MKRLFSLFGWNLNHMGTAPSTFSGISSQLQKPTTCSTYFSNAITLSEDDFLSINIPQVPQETVDFLAFETEMGGQDLNQLFKLVKPVLKKSGFEEESINV